MPLKIANYLFSWKRHINSSKKSIKQISYKLKLKQTINRNNHFLGTASPASSAPSWTDQHASPLNQLTASSLHPTTSFATPATIHRIHHLSAWTKMWGNLCYFFHAFTCKDGSSNANSPRTKTGSASYSRQCNKGHSGGGDSIRVDPFAVIETGGPIICFWQIESIPFFFAQLYKTFVDVESNSFFCQYSAAIPSVFILTRFCDILTQCKITFSGNAQKVSAKKYELEIILSGN